MPISNLQIERVCPPPCPYVGYCSLLWVVLVVRPVKCNYFCSVMSAKGPSVSCFPTLRRSACDRCRKHKLRCPPRANATQSCQRCVRAGLQCITGYTKPLGRASSNGVITSSHKNIDPTAVQIGNSHRGPLNCMDMDVMSLNSQSSSLMTFAFGSTSPWTLSNPFDDEHSSAQTWSSTTAQDEVLDSFFRIDTRKPLLCEDLHSYDPQLQDSGDRNNTLFNDLDVLFSAPAPSEKSSEDQITEAESIAKQEQRVQIENRNDNSCGAECDIRLFSAQSQFGQTSARPFDEASRRNRDRQRHRILK